MNLRELVVKELKKIYPQLKPGDKNVWIICPWHEEKKPSLSIALTKKKVPIGAFRCFGCEKSGNWNKLASKLNLKPIGKQVSLDKEEGDFSLLCRTFKTSVLIEEEENCIKLPENLYEWEGNWRGLSDDFLKIFNTAKYYDNDMQEWRILFPIIIFGELKGYVHERIGNTKSLKHYNKFPSSKILYPTDLHRGRTVILVEGLADMLRLKRDKLPVLTFFGTGNWNLYKKNILISLGIENVIAFGDGDKAGWDINLKIYNDLKNDFNVKIVNLPKNTPRYDPANCPSKYIILLKKIVHKMDGGNL